MRLFFRIVHSCDEAHREDDLPPVVRQVGSPAEAAFAVSEALGQMEPGWEVEVHAERLSEDEDVVS